MIGFLGEYEATIDSKGRFLIPAGLKRQLPEAALQFVINRGFEKCLTLYTAAGWEEIFKKLSILNDFDPKVRQFRRLFLNGATMMDADSAGRLLLPQNLREYAGIEKDIIVVSAIDKIEIWDSKTYKELFEQFSSEGFSGLADEVMGNGLSGAFRNSEK
jgi:MraZ protein